MAFWTNFCFARNVFLAEIAVQQKMLFSQNTFFKFELALWTEMAFWQKIVFLPNLIKKSYFSKNWKVWLAFYGWKLSGLFLLAHTALWIWDRSIFSSIKPKHSNNCSVLMFRTIFRAKQVNSGKKGENPKVNKQSLVIFWFEENMGAVSYSFSCIWFVIG